MSNKFVSSTLLSLMLLVFGEVAFADGVENDKSTLCVEKYGICLTLPDRWGLKKSVNKKIRDTKYILRALDSVGEKNVRMLAIKIHDGEQHLWWAKTKARSFLKMYSKKYHGYLTKSVVEDKVLFASGKTALVVSHVVEINRHIREVAFVNFEHAGYYFTSVVVNNKARKRIEKGPFIREKFLPGLEFR
jgi:hypothetical protein